MEDEILPLSKRSVEYRAAFAGVALLIICGVISYFFARFVTVAPALQLWLLVILWVLTPLLWLAGTLLALYALKKTHYSLTGDALRVSKQGWFGTKTDRFYRYDIILAVESSSQAHGAFGTLTLRLAQTDEPLTIRHLTQPDTQAEKLKKRVIKSRPTVGI